MKVLEQWCTKKNTLLRLKYIQEMFKNVKLLKQWRLESFIEEKNQTSRWEFVRSGSGSIGSLVISI